MDVLFRNPDRATKANHVCDVEVITDPIRELKGRRLKWTGLALWTGKKETNQEEYYVTLPGVMYEVEEEGESASPAAAAKKRRKYDFLRSAEGEYGDIKDFMEYIVSEYKRQRATAA